jgi:hypothetical protein
VCLLHRFYGMESNMDKTKAVRMSRNSSPVRIIIQGGSNMTGTNCDLFTHNQSRSYLNHLVHQTQMENVE